MLPDKMLQRKPADLKIWNAGFLEDIDPDRALQSAISRHDSRRAHRPAGSPPPHVIESAAISTAGPETTGGKEVIGHSERPGEPSLRFEHG
jgi:hypothetical protein